MAVHDILAEEVAEIDQDSKLIVPPEVKGVLAAHLMRPGRFSVARQEAELVLVDVKGMAPAARTVPDDPNLRHSSSRVRRRHVVIEELAVDRPGAVVALEFEQPRLPHPADIDR